MALLALPTVTAAAAPCSWKASVRWKRLIFSPNYSFKTASITKVRRFEPVRAFFPNPTQESILKEALRFIKSMLEPVAFMGGILAGLLRLDLNEEPLKEWVSRTVEASGISAEELGNWDVEEEEEMPQQIEIE
ncbi:hypothetical protein OROMI_002949 [Orobanche minor]